MIVPEEINLFVYSVSKKIKIYLKQPSIGMHLFFIISLLIWHVSYIFLPLSSHCAEERTVLEGFTFELTSDMTGISLEIR